MKIKISILLVCFNIGMVLQAQWFKKAHLNTNNEPNIIYIYLDDLGYGDLGNFWQNQQTGAKKMLSPQMDLLANEGAMLTHHYTAAPVCAPARSSLLEGLHQGHASIRDNQFDMPLSNGLNVAQVLSKAGYKTMHIGKSGLAGKRNLSIDPYPDPASLEAHPMKRGFDQFFGFLYHNQGHLHYPEPTNTKKYCYFTDGYNMLMDNTELCYTTDAFAAKSKQWISEHRSNNPEQPFFLYLAYDVPHSALQVPTQAYPAGGGLNGGLQWTNANSPTPYVNTASGTKDSFIHPDYASKNWTVNEKKHATMIRRVDNAVADLLQLLKDLNIDEQTMIVFSSDNGPHSSGGQKAQSFQSYGNFNGIKRDMWEGGIRVPTICYYPGVIPAGIEVDFPSGQWDWLATFCELANTTVPAYTDGVSLMPSLKQENDKQVDKGYTYHEYTAAGATPKYSDFELSKRGRKRGQMQVIRMGDYKGVRYNVQNHSTPFEIYNVVEDEREENDLASSMPVLQQQMLDKVLQVRKAEVVNRPYDKELIPAVELENVKRGLLKSTYSGKYAWVPNFEYLSPIESVICESLEDINSDEQDSEVGYYCNAYVNVPRDGTYTFYLNSASNCHIMLHDIHLLDNDFHFSENEISSVVNLKAGYHPVRIFYQQNELKTPLIELFMSGPEMTKNPISFFFEKLTSSNPMSEASKMINLYPLPAGDMLNISLNNSFSGRYEVIVYDITGHIVYSDDRAELAGSKELSISVKPLKSGVYVCKIIAHTKGEIFEKQFIKA
ncbi:sulfatase-like hydrolase/transferase [Carboxylicivirga sp. M1479]|uniref:sulfatase-like hydrolase/transferase n=1 Tax=Carboxylicivirga sp. M1479 TaxID=2594476 RepID=UPI0011783ED2|nr:sulfatase-like hydrolase/transferase [Carboxylicivirga sp. M1479]TRX66278.1 sulfatase-like hydrolase/transferase [Carboxylicivirga sp. M1479]